MKKNLRKIVIILSVIVAVAVSNYLSYRHSAGAVQSSRSSVAAGTVYFCPMHPNFTSDKPGHCPICGMSLVKKAEANPQNEEKKILYYRNPMNPEVTSPSPMKDSMGMDYVPVYAQDQTAQPGKENINISPDKQQLLGIKKETVQKRRLVSEIRASGRVAYDPDLFLAQEEYLAALKVKDQAADILAASGKKLMLMGMSPDEIKALNERGTSQESLYLPSTQKTTWVYASIYEYDLASIKEGMPVSVEAVAFPGKTFQGKVVGIKPALDAQTRSAQTRIEVQDPDHQLKPDMFVNVTLHAEIGEVLAISDEAVMDTGERAVVFVAKSDGSFETRSVSIGRRAQGYDEVLSGLKEGEEVVSEGNFFIDSESKLRA